MKNNKLWLAMLIVLWPTSAALAAVPTTVHVDAVVTNAAGGAVADGDYAVFFSLYKDAIGGVALWKEGPATISVKGGQLSWELGTTQALPPVLSVATPGYIEVQILPDPPLPRRAVGSVLTALRAATAENIDCSGCITAAQLDPKVLADYAKTAALAKVATSGKYADLEGGPDLSAYAKSALLAKVATTGNYLDLLGSPDLSVYAQTAGLAKVATTGKYADLLGTPALANVASTGAYADLQGAPTVPKVGVACGSGLVVKGINLDGTLNCIAALDPASIPPDGLSAISNGLLSDVFTDKLSSTTTPVKVLDYNPVGITDTLTIPDLGTAQKLTVQVDLTNSDISTVTVKLVDPANQTYLLWDKGGPGLGLKSSWPDLSPTAAGNLGTWVGKNPKGKWYLTVIDNGFLANKPDAYDGVLNAWSITVQSISDQKVQASGMLVADGGLKLKVSASDPVPCNAAYLGYVYVNSTDSSMYICNGTSFYPVSIAVPGSQNNPALSCKDLLAKQPKTKDGSYWVDPNGGSAADAFQVYCDMTTAGGGWTVILSARRLAQANFDRHGTVVPDNNLASINPQLQSKYLLLNTIAATDQMRFVCFDNENPRVSLATATVDVAFPKATADLFNANYMAAGSAVNITDSSNWYDTTGTKRIGSNGSDDFYMGGPITNPQYENVNWGWVDAKGSACSASVLHWTSNPGYMANWANGGLNTGDWFILVR